MIIQFYDQLSLAAYSACNKLKTGEWCLTYQITCFFVEYERIESNIVCSIVHIEIIKHQNNDIQNIREVFEKKYLINLGNNNIIENCRS